MTFLYPGINSQTRFPGIGAQVGVSRDQETDSVRFPTQPRSAHALARSGDPLSPPRVSNCLLTLGIEDVEGLKEMPTD